MRSTTRQEQTTRGQGAAQGLGCLQDSSEFCGAQKRFRRQERLTRLAVLLVVKHLEHQNFVSGQATTSYGTPTDGLARRVDEHPGEAMKLAELKLSIIERHSAGQSLPADLPTTRFSLREGCHAAPPNHDNQGDSPRVRVVWVPSLEAHRLDPTEPP